MDRLVALWVAACNRQLSWADIGFSKQGCGILLLRSWWELGAVEAPGPVG